MTDETQTVVNDDDAVVNQTAETNDALDSIDDFLKEYETDHQPQKVEQPTDNAEIMDWIRSQKQEKEREQYQQGVNNAVESIKKDLGDVKISDRVIRGMLHDLANQNPKVNTAFNNRFTDPGTWNRVLKAAAKDFAKEFQTPDPEMTRDREAVASAVRSASTAKPTPTEDQASFEKKVSTMDASALDNLLREMG